MLPAPAAHEMRIEPHAALQAVQEWEGYVVEITASEFVARLVDLTAGSSHEEEEAIITLQPSSARVKLAARDRDDCSQGFQPVPQRLCAWACGLDTGGVDSGQQLERNSTLGVALPTSGSSFLERIEDRPPWVRPPIGAIA